MSLILTIPSLSVREVGPAVAFYADRFGFECRFSDDGFAVLVRDGVVIHLWAAADEQWKQRADLVRRPVTSGAESFLAGTNGCRVQTDDIQGLYRELAAAAVLHPRDQGAPQTTDHGTVEFYTLDLDGNLLTFFSATPPAPAP